VTAVNTVNRERGAIDRSTGAVTGYRFRSKKPQEDSVSASKKAPSLEKAMSELEQIVEQLEGGELTLEKSLAHFEKGVKISRECQKALTEAEQKVQILLGDELRDAEDPQA
jgi:exodeoxyribonuclease VII small subunit